MTCQDSCSEHSYNEKVSYYEAVILKDKLAWVISTDLQSKLLAKRIQDLEAKVPTDSQCGEPVTTDMIRIMIISRDS